MMWRALLAVAVLAAGCAAPERQAEPPRVLPHDPAPAAHFDPVTCARLSSEGPLTVVYPAKAWEIGQEGWVHLRFDVDAQGAATNVRQLAASPPAIFDDAARDMLAKIKFVTPSLKDCEFVFGFDKTEASK